MERLIQVIEAGGWVMAPLLLLSLLTITLVIERAIFWMSARGKAHPKLLAASQAGDLEAAAKAARKAPGAPGQFARDLLAAIEQGRDPAAAANAHLESARPRLERWSATFAAIITAAPMLGILGTVTGIIQSFSAYRTDTAMQLDAVADGIAEALITTALGLSIALITLFPAALFRALAARSLGAMRLIWSAAAEGAASKDP